MLFLPNRPPADREAAFLFARLANQQGGFSFVGLVAWGAAAGEEEADDVGAVARKNLR